MAHRVVSLRRGNSAAFELIATIEGASLRQRFSDWRDFSQLDISAPESKTAGWAILHAHW